MAVKTYYLGSGQDGNFGAIFDGVAQTAASRTDGWTVAKIASTNASDFDAATKQASGTFAAASGKPSALITSATANALKTPAALTGVFANTAWTFSFAVRAVTLSAQAGRMRLRVYKSANADGSAATELTSAAQIGTTSSVLSTSADVLTTVTWSPGATITLNNEYLFFVIAWEITTASGSNSGDVVLRTGSTGPAGTRLVTPDFSITKVVTPATVSASFGVSGQVVKRFQVKPTNIVANSTVAGVLTVYKPPKPIVPGGVPYSTRILSLSPISYWRLGESSGTVAVDAEGLHDGTYSASPTLGVTGLISDTDKAMQVNGVAAQGVVIGNQAEYQISTVTLEAWIQTSSQTGFASVIVKQFAYGMFVNLGVLTCYDWTASERSSGVNIADGQRHHVVTVLQGGVTNGSRHYIDGQPVGTPFSFNVQNQTTGLMIGMNPASGQEFIGIIDEVAIYGTALSAANVLSNYNAGIGGAGAGPITWSNSVSGVVNKIKAPTPIAPGGITFNNAVSGSIRALRKIAPTTNVTFNNSVSGALRTLRRVAPTTNITFNNAVSGAIRALRAVRTAQATFTISVSGLVSRVGAIRPITPSGGGPSLLDNFNRADSGSLGSNWSLTNFIFDDPEIVSNRSAISASAGETAAHWNVQQYPADQSAQVTVYGWFPGYHLYLLLNVDTTLDNCYLASIDDPGSGTYSVTIYRRNGGSWTTVGDYGTAYPALSDGDTIGFRHVGGSLEVLKNGVSLGVITDGSPLTNPGNVGFGGRNASNLRVDDFVGGGVGVGGGGAITWSNSVSGALSKISFVGKPITPTTNVTFTNAVSGAIRALRKITPAGITATFNTSGVLTALKRVTPTQITFTNTVSGSIRTLKRVAPTTNVTWTNAVSGGIRALRAVRPAGITATFTTSGAVTAIHKIAPSPITWTNNVTGVLTKQVPGKFPTPTTQLTATFSVSGTVRAIHVIRPTTNVTFTASMSGIVGARRYVTTAQATWTNSVSGSIVVKRGIRPTTVITFNTSVVGAVLLLHRVAPLSQITFTSTVTGSVKIVGTAFIAPTTITWTNTTSGKVGTLRKITPAAITYTNTVTGVVRRARGVRPTTQISATFTISGGIRKRAAIAGAITFSTNVAGSIVRAIRIPATMTWNNTVTATFKVTHKFGTMHTVTGKVTNATRGRVYASGNGLTVHHSTRGRVYSR